MRILVLTEWSGQGDAIPWQSDWPQGQSVSRVQNAMISFVVLPEEKLMGRFKTAPVVTAPNPARVLLLPEQDSASGEALGLVHGRRQAGLRLKPR